MVLRRGFSVANGERAIVVEDVITTGGSTKEVIGAIRDFGAKVVGVASIIDRSDGKVNFDIPFLSLAKMSVEAFKEQDCPLCKKGLPIDKPGSRK